MPEQTLAQELDALSKYGAIQKSVPQVVTDNLNKDISLRPYQVEALSRLFFYLNSYDERTKPTHLLFHMATGSGKTVLMAGAILYLYSIGYRNFLFFVNSTNIIKKTKENFLNSTSIKYLFNDEILVNGINVKFNELSNFQFTNTNDINIVFTTIQGLHSSLLSPKENIITFEDFEDKKIALISDEAHHINTQTKKSGQSELDIEGSWENTVQRIFSSNKENILLEFTATVDFEHIKIKEKYESKLLYQYTLKEFREDKYSKEVKVLELDTDNLSRALVAILLSQYRRKVAQDNGIYLKPVILFKSKTIRESQAFQDDFNEYLISLSPSVIEHTVSKVGGVAQKALDYFVKSNIALENLIKELQEEFSKEKCVSVNSKEESEEKQIQINTLEAVGNEIRAVFAVDKLNEGWDVLNLFDIVRLYDTRDSRGGVVGKTTLSEAQLIGRGARYFPFVHKEDSNKHKRKFDDDLENDLRILEVLYYHSSYNPRYISELTQALIATGLKPKEEKEILLKLKEAFKQTDFWQNGVIFLNSKVESSNEDKKGIDDYGVEKLYKYNIGSEMSIEKTLLAPELNKIIVPDSIIYNLKDFGTNVLRKAIDKIEFYRLPVIQKYSKKYDSTESLVSDFGECKVEVIGGKDVIRNLTQSLKLEIVMYVLEQIKTQLAREYKEFRGSTVFEALSVSKIFSDRQLKINIDEETDQEFGRAMSSSLNPELQMSLFDKNWYAYEDDYGTSEEKYLVRFINTALEKLEEKYQEIYLIRNSKSFKIFSFDDGATFEPDYVLFLKQKDNGKRLYYQIFIEPKGKHLMKTDAWKEEFLKQLSVKAIPEILHSDTKYSLIGLPFFNESLTKLDFANALNDITNST